MSMSIVNQLIRHRSQRHAERAALRERRRLARDLHDGLGQDLYAANLALAALRPRVPPDVHPQIDELIDRQVAMIQSARRLIDERADSVEGTMSLDEFIESLSDLVIGELGSDPVIDIAPEAPAEASRTLGWHAVLALREMISNAVRHSRASMIVVMIDIDAVTVDLSVTDDGVGFDNDTVVGRGLTNLRHRARQCGGRFTWSSAPGVGSTARWRVPLRTSRVPPLAGLLRSA